MISKKSKENISKQNCWLNNIKNGMYPRSFLFLPSIDLIYFPWLKNRSMKVCTYVCSGVGQI